MREGAPRPPRVAVVGAASVDDALYARARRLGAVLAERGAIVVCGGRSGVMEAAARGAAEAGGITVGILPGRDGEAANPWITVALPTGLGEARNALVARAGEAVLGVAGGWGTLSELALAAKMGIPAATLGPAPAGVEGLPVHEDPVAAAEWALSAASGYRLSSENRPE